MTKFDVHTLALVSDLMNLATDVVIKCADGNVPAVAFLLRARSKPLGKSLDHSPGIIDLQDYPVIAVTSMVTYIGTGRISTDGFTNEQLFKLYRLADNYKLTELWKTLHKKLNKLTTTKPFDVVAFSDDRELVKKASDVIIDAIYAPNDIKCDLSSVPEQVKVKLFDGIMKRKGAC